MITLKNYVGGQWQEAKGKWSSIHNAVTGEEIARCSTEGVDFKAALEYGRRVGGPALRKLNFQERGNLLKEMARVLNENLATLYPIATSYGATKFDAWMDIEGGIGTLGVYSSLGRKQLPASQYLLDGEVMSLSKEGSFAGRHILIPLEGVAVQINAFNFPCWGMLEKLAPSFLAGMPAIVKPATSTCWLTNKVVELWVNAGILPEGSLQLICGSVGDLLDHLTCQDVLSFTGSADTALKIKSHPKVLRDSVRVNVEADSLNCAILGEDVKPGTETFDLFVKEVVREMTVKAGQKCTAIRRVMVPKNVEGALVEALKGRLAKTTIGDPTLENVRMGPLANRSQVDSARSGVSELSKEAEIVFGDPAKFEVTGADAKKGSFFPPILFHCKNPTKAKLVHELEVFGPVSTVMGYQNSQEAIELARRGGGSLVASVFSEDENFIRQVTLGIGPFHGRLLLMNPAASKESTGHGSALPQLVHGGPGRAGGGEELAGLTGLRHYMIRVALQGSPDRLKAFSGNV